MFSLVRQASHKAAHRTLPRLPQRLASFNAHDKALWVGRLQDAKAKTGKSYDQIAAELGLTNAYTAMLFHGQAQLKPETEAKLQKSVPYLSDADIAEMKKCPHRSYDPAQLQEPNIYRTHEAVMHYGLSIKALINEKFGDGIMSAIDFYVTVDKTKGKHNEDRVVITFNGKFLPHIEQKVEDMTYKPKL
eukprot:comp25208_c0_seq1/m.46970 comp25208_c0_seq1/g.46970  ORF comp25208_c0_seq1/g.46970 comp25208_c0_seq1/m.46970 type:complete len:189 (-) comp25208_c0_seq1:383-949(-)